MVPLSPASTTRPAATAAPAENPPPASNSQAGSPVAASRAAIRPAMSATRASRPVPSAFGTITGAASTLPRMLRRQPRDPSPWANVSTAFPRVPTTTSPSATAALDR